MSVFESLSSAERARQLRNPEGEVGLAVAAWLGETNRQPTTRFLALLGIEPQSRVLEVGFGNGRAVPDVLARAKDGHYAGIDISPTMVDEAKRLNARFVTLGRAEFHCAEAEQMPFPDATFDRAFSIGVVHFWPDPINALRELRRVLRSSSFAILGALAPPATTDFAKAEFGFYLRGAATWEALCREAGFQDVKAETVEAQLGAEFKVNAVRVELRA